MIGKYSLEIGQKSDGTNDFLKGMATSAGATDGGFSPQTVACNISTVQGVMYAPVSATDKTGSLSGNIIASADDSSISPVKYFVTNTGKYYTFDGSSLTLQYNDSANNTKYTAGRTDIVQYRYKTYATTTTNLNYFENQDLSTTHINWKTFTNATSGQVCNHPMIEWNGNLYIADGYQVHMVSGDTPTYTVGVLTLSTTATIVSLGIDPGSGKIMLGVTSNAYNFSDNNPSSNAILLWDGFNPTVPSKTIPVGDMVTAFYNIGGTVYIAYGQNLGYFNGTGISFIRKLKNVSLSLDLIYKHRITSVGNTLLVADGAQILAYGEVEGGKPPIPRYIYVNQVNSSTKFDVVCNLGNNLIGLASTAKLYTYDINSVASITSLDFYSKRYMFPRPIYLRNIFVEYDTQITNGQNPGAPYIIDDTGTSTTLSTLTASGTQGVLSTTCRDIKTRTFQLRYVGDSVATGVRRFTIMYDIAE